MGYRIGYNGPQVDDLLQKGYKYSVINNGWTKLESSDLAATNLDTLVTPGNYSTSFWQNGPIQLVTNGPINVCVTKDSSSNTLYQTIYDAGKIYIRSTTSTSFSNTWREEQNNSTLDIGASTPVNPSDNYIWIDTSGDAPIIKIYKENRGEWVAISAADLAKKSVYDKNNIGKPFTTYLDEKIAEGDLATAEDAYKKHIVEGEDTGNPIHVTSEEKLKWNAGISTSEADTLINKFKKDMQSYADEKVNTSSTKINEITTEVNAQKKIMDNHMGDSSIHLTADQVTAFDNKAAGDHTHLNDGTVTVSTTNLTGLIPIERLDPSVLERNYTVSSYDDLFNLTKNEVQNGDSVYVSGEPHEIERKVKVNNATLPIEQRWTGICYGNDKFVAVTGTTSTNSSACVAYSTDGITWTEGTLPSTKNWNFVCYGSGKFVMIASASYNNNHSYYAYSTDGVTWTEGELPSYKYYYGIMYGNGKYIAYASNLITYSTDGVTWTDVTITGYELKDICYGDGRFVSTTTKGLYQSIDGITWTYLSETTGSITYGIGKYVIIDSDCSVSKVSSDLENWAEGQIRDDEYIGGTSKVYYSAGRFVAITYNDVMDYSLIYYSTDGIAWNFIAKDTTVCLSAICYGNNYFIAVGTSNNGNYTNTAKVISIEAPRIEIESNNTLSSLKWISMIYANNKYTILDRCGNNNNPSVVAHSTDGKNWTYITLPLIESSDGDYVSQECSDIIYANGIYVIATYYWYPYYSTDGINWNIGSRIYDSVGCNNIAYGNDKFVMFGHYQKCAYSTDGINWTPFEMPNGLRIYGYYCNDKFIAVSHSSPDNNIILYSTDGVTWTEGTLPTNEYWESVCYGNNIYIAIASYVDNKTAANYAYSYDGINWYKGELPVIQEYQDIVFDGTRFVAGGLSAFGIYSYDGINWVSFATNPLYNMVFDNETIMSTYYGLGTVITIKIDNLLSQRESASAWFVVDDTKFGDYALKQSLEPSAIASNIFDGNVFVTSICYGNGRYVGVTQGGYIYSTDGITWTQSTLPVSEIWASICYGNGKFIAIANASDNTPTATDTILYSTDGITWTEGTMPSSQYWMSVCYGNDKFVAIADQTNKFAYSTDGINWTQGTLPSTQNWKSVCYGNDKFVIISFDADVFTYSTDGIAWNEVKVSHDYWYDICYGNGYYIAVTCTNKYAYSTNGINWTVKTMTNSGLAACNICYGDSGFISVGYLGYGFFYTKLPTALVQYAAPTPELTWDNITNKPTTISDYGLSNTYYTADEINTLYNQYKTQYDEINKSVSDITDSLLEIPEDLSTTYDTNLARASELNKKLDDLLHSLGLNDKMISDMVNMYKERSIIYRSSLDTGIDLDLDSLTVGSTFMLGKYQVESEDPWDIEWEIVHQTDDYQIAMTKQIIDVRCFDAKEPNNTDSSRKSHGNNNWQYSNIEQWMNSDQASWYSAQHQYDAPPSSANCWQYYNGTTYNAYDTHKGFLYYWSADEKALLKDMTLTFANNTVTDGGGSYTWTGKVWLPTYTQMSGGQNNRISEGEAFSKFTNNSSRIKTLHPNCAANNEVCKIKKYISGARCLYWMSSADTLKSSYVHLVDNSGSTGYYLAYYSDGGLAPCICLPRHKVTHDPSQKTVTIKYSYTNSDSDALPTEVINNKPTGESFTFDILNDSDKSYTHSVNDTNYPSGQVVDADDGSGYWTFSGWNTDDATIKS